jgi:hypothetical protein
MEETWKPVVGFENHYEVSTDGRIRRTMAANSTKVGWVLTPNDHNGYRRVSLHKGGKCHRLLVHRIVAQAYLDGFEKVRHVNHKNGVKHDNRVENLEWVTARENVLHAWKNGLATPNLGEDSGQSVLTAQSVQGILVLLANGVEGRLIAKAFGVTESAISSIKRGQTWTCVSKEAA